MVPTGKRLVIIGGTGCIGPWVARRLLEWGCEVTAVHRGERESEWVPDGCAAHSLRAAVIPARF